MTWNCKATALLIFSLLFLIFPKCVLNGVCTQTLLSSPKCENVP